MLLTMPVTRDVSLALVHPYNSQPTLGTRQITDDLPKLTTTTFIGIMIAISGNILISLALNLQKLAHGRVEADIHARQYRRDWKRGNGTSPPSDEGRHRNLGGQSGNDENPAHHQTLSVHGSPEAEPTETGRLIPFPQTTSPASDYGTLIASNLSHHPGKDSLEQDHFLVTHTPVPAWFRPPRNRSGVSANGPLHAFPVDIVTEESVIQQCPRHQETTSQNHLLEDGNETEYLKSKLWWFGFLLMNVGETGNFISYAWAPASVVAPLGTFALMSNCIFAPLILGERFRKRDLLGILIAIIGAVTVVLASNASDTRLDPNMLLYAISQTPFIIYSCSYLGGAVILATLSHSDVGRRWVFVDVGLCALFGGFTVLSTKAISTLLTMEWIAMFSNWITYPVLATLVITGVGQIRYLNRALMRFDSKVVIPVQFVLFTLSAITGSAILYGDFKKAKFHQIVTFLYGCAATFLGVFIIAWAPNTDHQNNVDVADDTRSSDSHLPAIDEDARLRVGSVGRRRAAVILPGDAKENPRNQRSTVGHIGLSPAQHLLLVHTPPQEFPIHSQAPRSGDRRRTMSWLESGTPENASTSGTRDNSITRLRNAMTRFGTP